MGKFEVLTKYIPMIQTESICGWITEQKNDCMKKGAIQMPVITYSEMVGNFIHDVYTFEEQNKNMELTRYNSFKKNKALVRIWNL